MPVDEAPVDLFDVEAPVDERFDVEAEAPVEERFDVEAEAPDDERFDAVLLVDAEVPFDGREPLFLL